MPGFDKHFGTVLTEEIRKAKFCTEVFVIIPQCCMNRLNILESPSHMSPLCAIVICLDIIAKLF